LIWCHKFASQRRLGTVAAERAFTEQFPNKLMFERGGDWGIATLLRDY
jgi:hypothetical protein